VQAKRKLPAPVRALNAVGGSLARLGVPLVKLDADSLLARAQNRTGLDDFGAPTFAAGLERLIESLESDARLSTLGRIIARTELVAALENRLGIESWRKRHPEIAAIAIERPIFIVGMPRTGTSILHELLATDAQLRVPMSWEVERPCPPPREETYTTDTRIAEVQRQLDRSESLIPDFKRMHPMGAELPQECVRITACEFASMIFQTTYRVPSYARWLHESADLAPAYAWHRRFLQHLWWRCPRTRWLLKSPGHLWSLERLLAEYPDACLIQTHRDPLRIIASLTSLVAVLRSMASDEIDGVEIAREWAEHVRTGLERSVAARSSGVVGDDRVIDIQFRAFMADPIACVRAIYDRFGLEFRPEAERRMREFLAVNPDDKHGRHAYRFADTGLDLGEQRALARPYQEFFDVPSESDL
jgi:hypothetical protein